MFDRALGYRLPTARYANDIAVLSIDDGELQAIQNALASGLSGDNALNAAFEENSRDVARIGGS
jgi:hypothetical protein